MDIVEIKQDINRIQMELLGRQIDARTLSYWTNIISSGTGDIGNFIENIIFSEEYKICTSSSFRDLFYSLVGFTDIEFYIDTFNKCVTRFIQENKRPFDKVEIIRFITSLDCYKDKYSDLIKKEYKAIFAKECDQAFISDIMNKFENQFNFDTNLLLNEINNHVLYKDNENMNKDVVIDKKNTIILDSKILEDFYNIFKRPMFVEEYFYYFDKDCRDFLDIFSIYSLNFNRYRKITRDYKNINTTEYSFVKEYIDYVGNDEMFFSNIINNIVNSTEYEEEMKGIINKKYYEIFNEDLENDDIDYYFKVVKELKIPLESDSIENSIVNLKKETDVYINIIFEKFINVVDRKPDIYEISVWLVKYREIKDNAVVDLLLEEELVKSLEFNEIIKKKIQNKYNSEFNCEIMPSLLYKEINKIVKQINNSNLKYDYICEMINNSIYE